MATQPKSAEVTDQPRGPFWIDTDLKGQINICCRNGKILFRYQPGQEAMADAHLKGLQGGYRRALNAKINAAEDLFNALNGLLAAVEYLPGVNAGAIRAACEALAKAGVGMNPARGEAAS